MGAARRRRLSPGQQTHCIVVGVIVEECVPTSLTFNCHHHILEPQTAEQSFHCQHHKPVCRAKLRSHRKPWPKVQGHGRDRKTGKEHLLGLVGKCSLFCHLLQSILTHSGICSVLQKTWTNRATKREGATIDASGDKGRWMISHSALVACKKQNTQRPCLGIALGHGGTSLAAPEPAPSPGLQ